jgi:DNA-binding MarR family transcriptional regulator
MSAATTSSRYTNNLLGALAVGLTDRIGEGIDDALRIGGRAGAALLSVGTRPGQTIDQLAHVLVLSHSATVRLTDRLAKEGVMSRRRASGDARAVVLQLTRTGHNTFRRLLDARNAALETATSALTASERASLQRLLEKMLAELPHDLPEAKTICRLCEHEVCRGAACPVGSAV